MENKYIEPLKWWDNLQPNTKDVLIKKYKDSGIPEFDNTSEVFNKMTDWDRVVIIYEKETKQEPPTVELKNGGEYPYGQTM